MDWFKKMQMRLKFLSFVGDPTKTHLVFEIIALATDLKANQKTVESLEKKLEEKNSLFWQRWEDRWLPPTPSLNELSQFPKESLGYAYYQHLSKNNLDVVFFPKPEFKRVMHYMSYRMYHAHDLWHTLLGVGVSPEGEIEVQGFGLGQIGSPIAAMLIAGGMLNLLDQSPEVVPGVFDKAHKAYELGQNSKFLLDYPLEERLREPLEEVRKDLLAQ
ncbi:MAG: hypothetical protein HRT44_12215 [Bdellovibrionales bacterium]|nr:Coq4 family protein [Bdellovibrionales bacterium]NQZ20003.1 hypothetical protein [Bdellovibrionales bacterium]